MLFNCLKCGKSISTHRNNCSYCSCDTTEICQELMGVHLKQKATLKSRYKNTILSVMLKYTTK